MRTALLALLLFAIPLDQVRVTMRPAGQGPKEGIGEGIVEAPPERVFRAVSDLQHWEEFMPFVKESDARPQPDGSVLSSQRLELPTFIGERHYEIRARSRVAGGAWSLDWSYVPGTGNVKAHRGSWTITGAGPGRTRAVLRIYTDPGGAVPDWAMDRATARSLGWIFKGLRQQVMRWRYAAPSS